MVLLIIFFGNDISCRSIAKTVQRIDIVEEVFGGDGEGDGEEKESEEMEQRDATVSGLHKKIQSSSEGQRARLFITTEGMVRQLAGEARPKCQKCGKPTEVAIKTSGTSGHIEWVRYILNLHSSDFIFFIR